MAKTIYLDNAASAPVKPCAIEAAMPFLTECFGNPSSVHSQGRRAALAIIAAREQCAAALGADPSEIFFTSGGTESDNWAIFAAVNAFPEQRHIVTTAIEHPAVLNVCGELERRGYSITRLEPNSEGLVSAEQVLSALRADTALVSVMAANNEIGTLQPIAEIGEICRKRGVLFHTDAVQAVGNIPLDMREIKADMLSVSAHKLGGIKGSGLLFVRRGTPVSPLIFGGGQERGMRSGTENAAGIAALGAAMESACANIPEKQRKIAEMRDELIARLSEIPDARLNGSADKRLCGNVNFSFADVEGESLVLNLDLAGVYASSASACAGGTGKRSHVLKALGLSEKWLRGTLRLSLSEDNTMEEIAAAAAAIRESVERLRAALN